MASTQRSHAGAAFNAIVLITALVALTVVSGMANLALAAGERLADRMPVMVGAEAEARVQFTEPIALSVVPRLAAEWGVRVDGLQRTYAAPNHPITIGLVVPPGADLAGVLEEQAQRVAIWAQSRADRMLVLAAGMSRIERTAMEQNVADLRAVQAELALHGVRASALDVRGPTAAIDRIARLPGIGLTRR